MARILLAEDDPAIRELLKMALERDGHKIMETANGTHTWDLLQKEKVDLLVLDVMLPGMDGHTLQLHLAQDKALNNIPVIVITAVDTFEALFAKFPQVKQFVTKPFDPAEIAKSVKKILKSKN